MFGVLSRRALAASFTGAVVLSSASSIGSAAAASIAPAPGQIKYRQLTVSADGVTHIEELKFGGRMLVEIEHNLELYRALC